VVLAHGVVKREPGGDAGMGVAAVGVAFEVDILMLSDRHTRSMNTLSIWRPRPSIENRCPVPLRIQSAAIGVSGRDEVAMTAARSDRVVVAFFRSNRTSRAYARELNCIRATAHGESGLAASRNAVGQELQEGT
jgi:hypothetical protein